MSQGILLIFNNNNNLLNKKRALVSALFFAATLLISFGCTQATKKTTTTEFKQKRFLATYDNTWKALQQSLQNYPILVNNYDKGLLKTDFIKPNTVWRSETQKGEYKPASKYQIIVYATKVKAAPKEVVQLRVKKLIFDQSDFFSGMSKKPGNGYEEMVIIYRVHRELQIAKKIQNIEQ